MTAPVSEPLMTAEEFLALPDEPGVERWLINGRLREKRFKDLTMTYRNRWHSRVQNRIAYLLEAWLERQPEPRGAVHSGEAGCRLPGNPQTVVGIDVVYIAPEFAAQNLEHTTVLEGVPTLVVEILSPSDTQEDIHEKLTRYLTAGVALIWIVDPRMRTVTVYRPDALPVLFNVGQEISGESHLPGFKAPVAKFFDV